MALFESNKHGPHSKCVKITEYLYCIAHELLLAEPKYNHGART